MDGNGAHPPLVGVRILDTGEFEPCVAEGVAPAADELCVVETGHGIDLGEVLPSSCCQLDHCFRKGASWRILRKATTDDRSTYERKGQSEVRAKSFCLDRVRERSIPLKLVRVHYLFDGTKVVFYYTAEGRIDFRELVKDLARELRMKIEMRQIGVRDEARMLNGFGTCGRKLCCSSFLRSFEPVTLSMAKKQFTGCNPASLTGVCGRLKCCLRFEHDGNGHREAGSHEEDHVPS